MLLLGTLLALTTGQLSPASPDVKGIREALARGRYAEATELVEQLSPEGRLTPDAARWASRVDAEQGQYSDARAVLDAAIVVHPGDLSLQAERALVLAQEQNWPAAAAAAEQVLKKEPDQLLARFVQAEAWAATGELDRATEGYRWFVRYYNRAQPEDAERLMILGRGAAQYARWKSVTQIFDFLVNTVCVDALQDDPRCWQAHHLAGALLLEKYNVSDGLPELQQALAINPRAPAVHLLLAEAALEDMQYDKALQHAEQALRINPVLASALHLQAKTLLLQGQLDEADEILRVGRRLYPTDQRILAVAAYRASLEQSERPRERLTQILSALDQPAVWQPPQDGVEAIILDLVLKNPRPGYFLQELGQLWEGQRKFREAEACYSAALQRMPQLAQPKTELAMLAFQQGRLEAAQKLLDEAFKADPYHVRVSNMRKVLKVLENYAVITTPHFVIRVDSQFDSVLAKFMAEELEAVYADVTREYGFEPPQRTQIEVYNTSKGLAGHQWFSARMIGLPWLQTVGASTGLIIAMTSPTATEEPFNWARVLRHEFVHIVTLQQTDFNIPHWFTEALATRAEGYPPPESWNELLIRRVTSGQLKNLDTLHLGFQRAESREDWDFAYCQSVLYADYFQQRFGAEALPRLLNAFRTTRSIDTALDLAYHSTKEDVEAGYLAFLRERVSRLQQLHPDDEEIDAELAVSRYKADPQPLQHRAEYAEVLLSRENWNEAADLAREVLKENPHQQRAARVVAASLVRQKNPEQAIEVLTIATETDRPAPSALWLLSQLYLAAGQPDQALAALEKGAFLCPDELRWARGLAQAAEAAKQRELWKSALETLSRRDSESGAARLQRAQLALEDGDFETALTYGRLALQIDVLNVDVHATLARAYAGLGNIDRARDAFDIALQLKPGQEDLETERRQLPKSP